MKNRQGFVSNSSSSSFIVIGNQPLVIPTFDKQELDVPVDFGGTTEFGWEIHDHTDFGSRLNFAYLQSQYDPDWFQMLDSVVKFAFQVNEINWNISDDYNDPKKSWGYIDHQSSASEGSNTELFESKEQLQRFLFAPDSMIHTDNDNY